MQKLNPHRTTWHIAFGTYGTRLHLGPRPTVDKQHNRLGTPFLPYNPAEERFIRNHLNHLPRLLTDEQQIFIEELLPELCERGGWNYRICSASADHVHLLCDIVREFHGELVLRLVKRWLTQALGPLWSLRPGETWWAEEGSNKAVKEQGYLNNAYGYILRQRATQPEVAEASVIEV